MALETQPPAILRFGTFEVDLSAGEVRKQGKRIKLQEQPFQVLTTLLRGPGEVVSREELRKQIWSEDTHSLISNWAVPTPCRATQQKLAPHIRISSHCGKTPTLISPS